MYRVRRSWADEASQIGAYDILQNAIIAVKQNPGYFIFDDVGNAVVFSMFYWAKLKKKISTYAKGQSVRVFRMGDGKWYLRNNAVVPKKADMDLTKQVYDADFKYTKEQAEHWVNSRGFDSPTNYLYWCNKYGQRVYIFQGSKGNWTQIKTYKCGTGNIKYGDGSDQGIGFKWKIWDKKKVFDGPQAKQYWNMHYTSLHGNSIHKGPYGHPSTHGCIAMGETAVKWVFNNIPLNTRVIVF